MIKRTDIARCTRCHDIVNIVDRRPARLFWYEKLFASYIVPWETALCLRCKTDIAYHKFHTEVMKACDFALGGEVGISILAKRSQFRTIDTIKNKRKHYAEDAHDW